ncbi:hypothetical protein PGTUg99_031963 [Puccinia graminis f. sp. tritici]|nr:hypothetical protein PGTUg99_031963 [Puccinia graminis f. sp. tritici]
MGAADGRKNDTESKCLAPPSGRPETLPIPASVAFPDQARNSARLSAEIAGEVSVPPQRFARLLIDIRVENTYALAQPGQAHKLLDHTNSSSSFSSNA